MWKVVQLEKYFDFSLYSHHFFLLSLTSFLSAPEKEVTSPYDFKVVGALRYIWNIVERGVKHHNPIPNTTSLWFYSLMLQRSIKCQFYNLWFDPIMAWTHNLPNSSRAYYPWHHQCGFQFVDIIMIYICKTQIGVQPLIDVQFSNPCRISTYLRSMSFFKFSNRRPILKSLAVFHFLKSTSEDVTDICRNPNPNTNQ